MSVNEAQTFGRTRAMFEGYGGPVNITHDDVDHHHNDHHDYRAGIDPALDACCQREVSY